MSDATANKMTVREFFDKLEDRLTYKNEETGETTRVLARDKELISFLKGYYNSEPNEKIGNDVEIFSVCWVLHCLRHALYDVITQDIKEPYSKYKAINTYKTVLKTDYEKEDELKT